MALVTKRHDTSPSALEDLKPSTSEVFGAAVEASLLDNPVSRISTYVKSELADSRAQEEKLPMLSKQQAEELAKDRGVQINNMPESISQEAFDILAERQYQRKKQESILANSDHPFAEVSGSLLGGLADPINIAASFIPIPGIGGLTGKLAQTGSKFLTRSLVRAQIGAIEGAAGAALIEGAINVPLAGQIGDNYGAKEVAANIAFGTIGGAALHPTIGAIGEGFKKIRSNFLDMPIEAKNEATTLAASQVIDDRSVNVDAFDKARANQVIQELNDADLKQLKAVEKNDPIAAEYFENQKNVKAQELESTFEGSENIKAFDSQEIKASVDESMQGKGDRYLSEAKRELQDVELNTSPYNDFDKNLESIIAEEQLTFDEAMKQMEIDGKKVLEPFDQIINETKDFSMLAKAFANCITRGR